MTAQSAKTEKRFSRRRAVAVATLLLTAGVAPFIGSTYSAFSSKTNHTSDIAAGTVVLNDNLTAGSSMLTFNNMKPGDTATACINVSYTGSLPATVKMYNSASSGTNLDQYLTLTVTRGALSTPSGTSCSSFTPAGGSDMFSGNMSTFPTTYATGVSDASQPTWGPGNTTADTRAFKVTATLQDNNAAQGLTTSKTLTWEAQNN